MFSDPQKNLEQFDVTPPMIVGDFGSGSGHYSLALAKMVGDGGRVYAIDIQKELLSKLKNEAAKNHIFNIDVIWADFETPLGSHLKDKTLDRAVVSNVLFQINDKGNFIKEVERVLRPSGKVLVIDWSDAPAAGAEGVGPDKKNILAKDACRKLFEKNGFVFEREINAGEHHYGFIFSKA